MMKAVIFDMDGVIVDSEPIESLAWEKVLAEYGIKPIFNSNGLIHEVGATNFNDIMDRHNIKQENFDEIRIKKRAIFEELIINFSPIKGIVKLLNNLKKQKIKLAVASTRNERHVKMIIGHLGLDIVFSATIGFGENVRRKPFPDVFLKAAEELRIDPSLCVVIEDSGAGVMAGKSAGMKVIAVPSKYTAHQDFSKADKVVNSLSEISLVVLKSL